MAENREGDGKRGGGGEGGGPAHAKVCACAHARVCVFEWVHRVKVCFGSAHGCGVCVCGCVYASVWAGGWGTPMRSHSRPRLPSRPRARFLPTHPHTHVPVFVRESLTLKELSWMWIPLPQGLCACVSVSLSEGGEVDVHVLCPCRGSSMMTPHPTPPSRQKWDAMWDTGRVTAAVVAAAGAATLLAAFVVAKSRKCPEVSLVN